MRIALATTDAVRGHDFDRAPLVAALAAEGLAADSPSWDDPSVDWSVYALVLPRSTWNYPSRPAAFLEWAARVASVTRLENPLPLLRFSADKRYLLALERDGVPVVASHITEPGEVWRAPEVAQFVVKPTIGADARGVRRFRAGDLAAARAHAVALAAAGHAVLTQPYLAAVDAVGETGLVFLEGAYSHAIRKGALLREPDAPSGAAGKSIEPRAAADDEIAVGRRALAALPGGAPLYARVDVLRDETGRPRLLELELVEPRRADCRAAAA